MQGEQPSQWRRLVDRQGDPFEDMPPTTPDDGEPIGSMLYLVADLEGQHERMQQMSADFGRLLDEARVAADQVKRQLQFSSASPGGRWQGPPPSGERDCISPEMTVRSALAMRQGASAPAMVERPSGPSIPRDDSDYIRPEPTVKSEPGVRQAAPLGDSEPPLEEEQPGQAHRACNVFIQDGQEVCEDEPVGARTTGTPASRNRSMSMLDGIRMGQHLTAHALLDKACPEKLRVTFSNTEAKGSESSKMAHDNLVRRNAVMRLQARLGKENLLDNVNAAEVYKALTGLGLVKYSPIDLRRWLSRVMHVKQLNDSDRPTARTRTSFGSKTRASLGSISNFWNRVVCWRSSAAADAPVAEHHAKEFLEIEDKGHLLRDFADTLLDDEHLGLLDTDLQEMSLTIREVLFSGDANRLVAELTHVCIDDIAAPHEKPDLLTILEPVVGIVIFVNGIVVGLESGCEDCGGIDTWFWFNVFFTSFFLLESCLRAALLGVHQMLCGHDKWWNVFDLLLIGMSLGDIIFEIIFSGGNVAPLAVMRILRLLRLSRLVRIFRLRYMRELTLMVRGLLGGLYTLFWAIVLLCFTLYMIACLATSTIGRNASVPELVDDQLFSSVFASIFTCFRCLMGDCNTSNGRPIVKLLSDRYGTFFTLSYVAIMMFITFGLFNLIIAIYIENTLNAAKMEGEKNKAQRQRESVRIARLTRQLLKKFCAIQKAWGAAQHGDHREIKQIIGTAAFADIGKMEMPVTKEMFLCVIQDPSVQKLMDDLDIPSERAALFDVLDADGSGGLEVVELITGLLRVRGEAKKSDAVGTLLAVRVLQDMIREQSERLDSMEGLFRSAEQPRRGSGDGEQPKKPVRASSRSHLQDLRVRMSQRAVIECEL